MPIKSEFKKILKKYCLKKNKQNEYDFVFSLGEACFCSAVLVAVNLRTMSSPFDWLFKSDFIGRVNILNSKFINWLNIEDLEYIDDPNMPSPCDKYKNKKTGIVYLHDFDIDTPLEISYPKVKEKYERRIKRLLDKLSVENSKVLIVYIEYPGSEMSTPRNSVLINEIEKLNQTFNADIHLIYIKHDEKMPDKKYKRRKINDKITVINAFNYNRKLGFPKTERWENPEIAIGNIKLKDTQLEKVD